MNPIYTRIAGNLAYSMVFLVLLIVAGYCYQELKSYIDVSFNPYPLMYYSVLVPILFGVFLALLEFYKKVRQPGAWSFDWIRFLVLGLPALYIAFIPLGHWTLLHKIQLYAVWARYPTISTFAGVLFGYVALMSLEKRNAITAPEDKDAKYNQGERRL